MFMKNNEKPLFIFNNSQILVLLYGIIFTLLFCGIYFAIAVIHGKIDYFSFFFNNINNNIFLTFLAILHVSLLGIGMVLILIAFFNLSPKIACYNKKFKIFLFLQKEKVIDFDEIKNIEVKLFYNINEGFFSNNNIKECRIYFNNPIYNFYLSYPISGYFDNIQIDKNKNNEFLLRRALTDRKSIESVLKILDEKHGVIKPYLPEGIITK